MAAENPSAGWWQRNGKTLVWLLVFFAIALFIRSYFNFDASYNDGDFRWSGTDPYYHMRVVDHIRDTGQFLLLDPLINYPVGATNPRPPLFDWTIAAAGGLLAPFFGGDAAASTDHVAAFSPAVWGALTVFPMYALGAAAFGRKAGLWSAFFIAVMAAHVSRSNLGGVDHDATILFFLTLGAFFFVKSLRLMNDGIYVEDYRRSGAVGAGWRRYFRENQASIAYAALTGAAIAGIALTWKGYPYALAIMAVWFGFQLLSNHLRGRDSTGHFVLIVVAFLVTLALIWPYYTAVNRIHSAVYPALYILAGILLASLIFVPTRHLPPVLVLPMTVGGILIGLLVLLVVLPDIGRLFFTGLGYFVQDKLYSTIAEAQRTPLGYLVFSTGVMPFFFGLAGIVYALISFIKHKRNDHLFVLVWSAVALFMSFTATRFVFNASVGFAVLAGWMTARFIAWVRFGEVGRSWRNVRSAGFNVVKSTRSAVSFRHVVGAVFVVFLLVVPSVWAGVDAGVPGEYLNKRRAQSEEGSFERDFWTQYFGAFGQDFLSASWTDVLAYLKDQDQELDPADRPAFIAWWDYGFYAVQKGQHPTVADPFQFGYQISGRFLASQSEEEGITWLSIRLLEGNLRRGEEPGRFDADVRDLLEGHSPGLADRIKDPLSTRDYDAVYAHLLEALPNEGGLAPTEEAVVSFYRDLREVTGKSIRYFTLEGRMFPCDDPRSQGIDSPSIFYAPVFLADKNPEDFVRTMYRDSSGARYFQRIYETTPDNGSRQLEEPYVEDAVGNKYLVGSGRLFPMTDSGQLDYQDPASEQGIPLAAEELEYQQAFYNTLLYRAWIGPAPEDPEDKIPPPTEYAPGQDLKHFRLVYTNVRTGETDEQNRCLSREVGGGYADGVAMLKYYDGAPVSGRVLDSDGQPMSGVTVRVTDNFGVVHDTTQAGEDGGFELSAPFSNVDDPSERAALERRDTLRGTGPNQIQVVSAGAVIASQAFNVTDEQSMGGGDAIPPFELRVELSGLAGVVFEDLDGDGVFNETDQPIAGADVRLGQRNATTDDQGRYSFDKVQPGNRQLVVNAGGYQQSTTTTNLPPGATATVDVQLRPEPINVTGRLMHDSEAVQGATVTFSPDAEDPDATGSRVTLPSDDQGNYTVQLSPGTWFATVDFQTQEDGTNVRYFTESPVQVDVTRAGGAIERDIELQREEL